MACSDFFYPDVDGTTGGFMVPYTSVAMGALGSLSSGGYLMKALNDGEQYDVTPTVSSLQYYNFSIAVGQQYLFNSQCIATVPTDQARTTIGVGEQVSLLFSPTLPLPAAWSTTAGALSAQTGYGVTFTAPDRAGSATVTATVLGERCTISFTIVEPTGYDHADLEQLFAYPAGVSEAGMQLRVVMAPTTVSFYKAQVLEVGMSAINNTGYFADPPNGNGAPPHDSQHLANQWYNLNYDNSWTVFDNAVGGSYNSPWLGGGGYTWPIPVQWRVGNGTPKQITGWSQNVTLGADGTVSVSKFGHTVTRGVNDGTGGTGN